jgi:glutathionyl-hydroquinone reductase
MGLLIEGQWKTSWYEPDEKGRFVRPETRFHQRVTADGSSGFPAAAGRYHLYASYACPWASRALILRALKKLEAAIEVSIVHPFMGEDGWQFADYPGGTGDRVGGRDYLRQVYVAADPRYTGRVTVPVLLDTETGAIVNNESRDLIEMLDREFDAFGDPSVRMYPDPLRAEVDAMIDANYETVNNGVYKAGFAESQAAHDEAVTALFERLDQLEALLARQRYLCGDRITAADWCLFTTLYRFDAVYYVHFKCNVRRVVDYPNLWAYVRELYQVPGVRATCNMDHVKHHYYRSHERLNPKRIVPRGPSLDFEASHDRDRLSRRETP